MIGTRASKARIRGSFRPGTTAQVPPAQAPRAPGAPRRGQETPPGGERRLPAEAAARAEGPGRLAESARARETDGGARAGGAATLSPLGRRRVRPDPLSAAGIGLRECLL